LKKNILLTTLVLLSLTTLVLSIPAVFAGFNNQNDDLDFAGKSVERGTGKYNGLHGCRPPAESGDDWVYVPSDLLDGFLLSLGITPTPFYHEWLGGPCCPSNMLSDEGNEYPLPNQCCNGPDYMPSPPFPPGVPTGEAAPGNHCECFEIRGYPFILLPPP
jgi:hypothetical protein